MSAIRFSQNEDGSLVLDPDGDLVGAIAGPAGPGKVMVQCGESLLVMPEPAPNTEEAE